MELLNCVIGAPASSRWSVNSISPTTRTHRLWREARNFQRLILKNRGHLSSYMAGLCPEVYRDALTDFIARYNPR